MLVSKFTTADVLGDVVCVPGWSTARASRFIFLLFVNTGEPTANCAARSLRSLTFFPRFLHLVLRKWRCFSVIQITQRLCPVCLHPVTARSVFKQTHSLRPMTAVFHINPPLACHHPPSLSLNSATPGPLAQSLWRLLLQRWARQRASGCIFMSLIMVELAGVLVIRILRTVIPARGATLNGWWLCSTRILGAAHPSSLTCSSFFFLGVCYHSSSWH